MYAICPRACPPQYRRNRPMPASDSLDPDLNGDGRRSTLERELHAKLRAADRDGNGVLDVRRFTRRGTGSHLHYIIEVEKRKRMYKWTAFFFLGTTALAGLRAGGLAGPFPLSIYGSTTLVLPLSDTASPIPPPHHARLRRSGSCGTPGRRAGNSSPRCQGPVRR